MKKFKFFKKREKTFKKDKQTVWFNINFYWELAVSFMLIAFISSLFFGYNLFMKVNKEFVLSDDEKVGQIKTIKKDRIDAVLKYFSAREKKSNQILNSPSPLVDPSL